MTTDPREPLTPEERGLAQRLTRAEAHVAPSAALDAAILAAARAELAASIDPSAASLRATPTSGQRRRPRWPTLLGLAASVTLAIGIAWQLRTPPHPAADATVSAPIPDHPPEVPVAEMERSLESGSTAVMGALPPNASVDDSNADGSRQIAPEPMAAASVPEQAPSQATSTVPEPRAVTSALNAPEVPATRRTVLPKETHPPLQQEPDANVAKPAPISRPSTTDVLESSVPDLSRDAAVDSRSPEAFRRSRSQSPSAFPATTPPSSSIHTEKRDDLPASATLGRSAADLNGAEYPPSEAAAPAPDAATPAAVSPAKNVSSVANGAPPISAERRAATPPPPPAPQQAPHPSRSAARTTADTAPLPSPVTASPPASSAEGGAELPAVGSTVSDSDDASKAENRFSPQQWLQHIRELRDHDDLDAAKASLRRFRNRHPDIAVPDDLRPLLDR